MPKIHIDRRPIAIGLMMYDRHPLITTLRIGDTSHKQGTAFHLFVEAEGHCIHADRQAEDDAFVDAAT